jgi:hypothetical protein
LSFFEHAPILLQPWQQHPRQLISWFDVLHYSARVFFWCGAALRTITADCVAGSAIVMDGEAVFAMRQNLDEKARQKALSLLGEVEREFRKVGVLITADTLAELIQELESSYTYSFEWLHSKARAIEALAEKEFKHKVFLYIAQERLRFWPTLQEPYLFGQQVANNFPSATFDISNSGVCLALGVPTASVFHLMRVLEIGLTALGKPFGVSLAHTNWGPAIEEIESKIRDMHKDPAWKALPDCKQLQEFYAQAASHFGISKDASARTHGVTTQCMLVENILTMRRSEYLIA